MKSKSKGSKIGANRFNWQALEVEIARIETHLKSNDMRSESLTISQKQVDRYQFWSSFLARHPKFQTTDEKIRRRDAMIQLAQEFKLSPLQAAKLYKRLMNARTIYQLVKPAHKNISYDAVKRDLTTIIKSVRRIANFQNNLRLAKDPRTVDLLVDIATGPMRKSIRKDAMDTLLEGLGFDRREITELSATIRTWFVIAPHISALVDEANSILEQKEKIWIERLSHATRPIDDLVTRVLPKLYEQTIGLKYGFSDYTRDEKGIQDVTGAKFVRMCQNVMLSDQLTPATLKKYMTNAKKARLVKR